MVWTTPLVELKIETVKTEVDSADGVRELAMEVSRLVFPAEASVLPGNETGLEEEGGVRVIVSVLVAESVNVLLIP